MPDIRDTVNRIKKWREVAKQLDDPFLKFITEYIAFNALLRTKYGYDLTDHGLVNEFKTEIAKDTTLKVKLKIKIKELKKLAPIKNVREINRNSNGRKEIKKEELDDIGEVMEAIYFIRCNLFHGDKELLSERNKKLVKIGYEILVDVNSKYLKS